MASEPKFGRYRLVKSPRSVLDVRGLDPGRDRQPRLADDARWSVREFFSCARKRKRQPLASPASARCQPSPDTPARRRPRQLAPASASQRQPARDDARSASAPGHRDSIGRSMESRDGLGRVSSGRGLDLHSADGPGQAVGVPDRHRWTAPPPPPRARRPTGRPRPRLLGSRRVISSRIRRSHAEVLPDLQSSFAERFEGPQRPELLWPHIVRTARRLKNVDGEAAKATLTVLDVHGLPASGVITVVDVRVISGVEVAARLSNPPAYPSYARSTTGVVGWSRHGHW